jgi:hypothetical protein
MRRTGVLAALIFASSLALAQPPDRSPDQRPFERVEQWKKVRLIEMLSLSEDQSVRFFARLNEHDNTRRSLIKEKGEALDRIERLVRNKAEGPEYEKVIPDIMAADAKIHDEQKRFFGSLGDILSSEQRAKLLLFERHFERELREAMRETQKRRLRGEEP